MKWSRVESDDSKETLMEYKMKEIERQLVIHTNELNPD